MSRSKPTVARAADAKHLMSVEAFSFVRSAFGKTTDKMITTRIEFEVALTAA
jgi:hypothetical protein